MDDLSIKVIFFGVSILIIVTVLSIIIWYFNTAQGIADIVSERVDIASSYDSIMNEDSIEDYLTGVEVRSLITKYVGDSNVEINITEISGQNPSNYKEKDIRDEIINYYNINNNTNWVITSNGTKFIKESKLDLINPTWSCKVDKVKSENKITLKIRLDVEK